MNPRIINMNIDHVHIRYEFTKQIILQMLSPLCYKRYIYRLYMYHINDVDDIYDAVDDDINDAVNDDRDDDK